MSSIVTPLRRVIPASASAQPDSDWDRVDLRGIIDAERAIETSGGDLQKFDLIISDWNMPVKTGIELLRDVRADPALKDIPFLMVTAEAEKDNVLEAMEAGVNNYILKPFTAKVLEDKLRSVFG